MVNAKLNTSLTLAPPLASVYGGSTGDHSVESSSMSVLNSASESLTLEGSTCDRSSWPLQTGTWTLMVRSVAACS